ncbi:MAG: aminotransferase class V-fold PLP-dependent enzyme [Chloroflexi bacterium]|nr:aminotransferase class V-fold PLP-dependent enzyme [Chloroflexota bacterium]
MDVAALRREIPALGRLVYLNTGWAGLSPDGVLQAVGAGLERERDLGRTTAEALAAREATLDGARRAVGRLLGAAEEEICLLENTSEGINTVVNGLDWQPGDEVVTCTLEHSSVLLPCFFLARRKGVRVRVAEIGFADSEDEIVERFGALLSPRTRLVMLSHVAYCSGLRLPVGRIARLAHGQGARLLVDGAQSVGQVVVDVADLDCDYYALPGQKWLLGPDGTGALWVRRSLVAELAPGKIAEHAATAFDFSGHMETVSGMRKFELTTQSAALFAGLTAAIDEHLGRGPEAVEAWGSQLAAALRERLSRVPGMVDYSPPEQRQRSGLVTFGLAGWPAEALTEALWTRSRIVARALPYPPAVRYSVACYNTADEMERAAAAVEELVKEVPG